MIGWFHRKVMTARMARRACTLMVSLAAVLVLSSGIPPLRRPVGGRGVASPMKNRIMFPGDSVPESFGRFYFLLSDALSGKGRVRILHLGDSHVQAGYFTGRLREDLLSQGYDIDAGLGLVFPYRILGTNNPSYYKSSFSGRWKGRRSSLPGEKASLGLMGLAAWVAEGDTASFTIDTRIPSFCEHPFDRAVVWGYHSGGSLSLPFAEADGNVLLPSSEGDGVYEFLLEDGSGERFESTSITVTVPKGFVVTGVDLSRASQGLTLSGAGVNGASYLSLMNCEDLERDLVRYAPDAVILALGTNDAIGPAFDAAGYRERARKVVDMIRKANPHCAIIFVTPPDSFEERRPYRERAYLRPIPTAPLHEMRFAPFAMSLAEACGTSLT